MEYKYYLPDSNNQAKEYVTKNNSLIIIGGNGTGKSKLGEWMEKKQVISTHRRCTEIIGFWTLYTAKKL